jgi:hypothetical protein
MNKARNEAVASYILAHVAANQGGRYADLMLELSRRFATPTMTAAHSIQKAIKDRGIICVWHEDGWRARLYTNDMDGMFAYIRNGGDEYALVFDAYKQVSDWAKV